MSKRLALVLPLAFLLGCGSAPPPPAAAPSSEPSAAGSASPASPSAEAVSTPPAAAKAGGAASPSPAPGKAAADAPILTAQITQQDILAVVNKHGDLFNKCYTLGAGASKSYRAKVTVKATVSPVGAVNAVEIVTSTAKNPKVDACVSDAFKKLTFARPAGSGATVFSFPLSFDGIEQVQ
jgi:hypothetical protein